MLPSTRPIALDIRPAWFPIPLQLMIEGLRGIRIYVSDLRLANDWYAMLLDRPAYREPSGVLTFECPGSTFEIATEGTSGNPEVPSDAKSLPLTKFAGAPIVLWGVDHLESELSRLASFGVHPFTISGAADASSQVVLFTDPFGNIVGLRESDDPQLRKARSQRAGERIALRNVREKVNELEAEQRQLERFGSLVIRVLLIALVALCAAFALWRM